MIVLCIAKCYFLHNKCFYLWRQVETSSFLLFSELSSGWQMIKYYFFMKAQITFFRFGRIRFTFLKYFPGD